MGLFSMFWIQILQWSYHRPPNTRSISQPSSPAAGSGRADEFGGGAEARVGAGR
jgi:hypothetical protein